MNKQQLIVELQTHGLKLVEHEIGAVLNLDQVPCPKELALEG